jgi:hypothetical protein
MCFLRVSNKPMHVNAIAHHFSHNGVLPSRTNVKYRCDVTLQAVLLAHTVTSRLASQHQLSLPVLISR